MEKKNNKVDFSSYFENDLFDKADIDLIDEKIQANIPGLLGIGEYMDLDIKISDINERLSKSLDVKLKRLFNEYQQAVIKANSYQNCLAYYLGVQAMANVDKLK